MLQEFFFPVFMKQKHNHFILSRPPAKFISALSFIKLPYLFVKWTISFLLARNITHLSLNPSYIKKQRVLNLVYFSDKADKNEAVVVNLFPHKSSKVFRDYLIKFSGSWFRLPFFSTNREQLRLDRQDDKDYIDKIIAAIDSIIVGKTEEIDQSLTEGSTRKKLAGKQFNWEAIHLKGLSRLDDKMRAYLIEKLHKKYSEEPFKTHRVNLGFFTLQTVDYSILDSVAVAGKDEHEKPISERQFVIACMSRDQNYINWLKDFKRSANKIGCTVIGFNYRGVDYSEGMVWQQDDMVSDVLAQIDRLLALGVKPENIGIEGMCLGGAVATIAAAKAHEKGIKVKLYNERSFRSIARFITGFIFPEKGSSLWNPINIIRYFLGGLVYVITLPFIWLAGSHLDAAKAWDSIPSEYKDYSLIHQDATSTSEVQTDGIVQESWASIESFVQEKKTAIAKKEHRRGAQLTQEELQALNDPNESHYFHVAAGASFNVPHFVARRKVVQDTQNEAQVINMHDHMIRFFKGAWKLKPTCENMASQMEQIAENGSNFKVERNPLFVATSGGTGHISAILGIKDTITETSETPVEFPQYQATLFSEISSFKNKLIHLGIYLGSMKGLGYLTNKLSRFFGFFELPDATQFWQEIEKLEKNEMAPDTQPDQPKGRMRPYVDMLLDVYQGYEYVAIVNLLYRMDKLDDIKRIIANKGVSEKLYYERAYNYFLNLLIRAAENGKPYTEIISTQPASIAALCDAVIEYNKKVGTRYPPVAVHQYLTDLPTRGCDHFLSTLADLTPEQKAQMHLHAVNIRFPIVLSFLDDGQYFQGIHSIKPHENPMIRKAFKDQSLIRYLDRTQAFKLQIKNYTKNESGNWVLSPIPSEVIIPPKAKVASVMLSSVASEASVDYVKELLENNYDKIFLFGGLQSHIYHKIQEVINDYSQNVRHEIENRIVCLGNQDDVQIAPILTLSDCVIIRGGGLTIMEQMALPQHSDKIVLIHNAYNTDAAYINSLRGAYEALFGLSWENGNADELIAFFEAFYSKITARKTSPEHVSQHLRLAAANNLPSEAGTVKLKRSSIPIALPLLASSKVAGNLYLNGVLNNNSSCEKGKRHASIDYPCHSAPISAQKSAHEAKRPRSCSLLDDQPNIAC